MILFLKCYTVKRSWNPEMTARVNLQSRKENKAKYISSQKPENIHKQRGV
jgi:hypothetical protein